MENDPTAKLYIRVGCSVCLSGIRKGVFVNCPYCDIDRKQVIEAPFSTVKSILSSSLTRKEREELVKFLQEE